MAWEKQGDASSKHTCKSATVTLNTRKCPYCQNSRDGEAWSSNVELLLQFENVALASAAVPLAKAAVLFVKAEQLVLSGIGPAKQLSVFHQLPQDFQGTSFFMDKNR